MRKKHFFGLLIIIGAVLFTGNVLGQTFPLQVSVNIAPPYSADYSTYFSSGGRLTVTINNTSPAVQRVYLAGSISTLDGSISVSLDPSQPWAGPALVVQPGSNQYSGTDLQPYGNSSNLDYTGITTTDIASGLLPEGDYRICLRAYDYSTLAALSAEEPQGCSNTFNISYPPAPQIINPECGSSVSRTLPQNIVFSWSTPLGLPAMASPQYEFLLVQLPDGIDPLSALENAVDPVFRFTTTNTILNFGSAQPLLISPNRYAWRVRVTDRSGQTQFQNEGVSEPCVFNYLEPGTSGNPFTIVYPLDGDTLPWSFMPIIHRFDPYSSDYTDYDKSFRIRRNGVLADQCTDHNDWPDGPQVSQNRFLSGITQEQSQHINLYKPYSSTPRPIEFTNGDAFDWDANITVTNSAGDDLIGSLSGRFVNGMGRPRPVAPLNEDSVLVDEPVTLRFTTSAPPQRLVPPYSIIQTGNPREVVNFFEGGIDERWVLEVSRRPTFDSLVTSSSQRIGQGLGYLSGSCTEQCLLDSLYKDVSISFTPNDTGWYYWRVRWLRDPSSATGSSYVDGPTWRFIVKDSLGYSDPVPPTPGVCVNTCAGPTITAAEQVPSRTAVAGNDIQIGLFTMRITDITWSGDDASGRGTINVPFLRAPMKVRFTDIRINSFNRVYQGEILGEYDNASVLPAGLIGSVAHLASLDETQSRALDAFVNSTARLVSQFTGNSPMGLPIGLDQTIDDQRVTIGVVGLRFTPESATLNAMISIDIAEAHGWLSLGATDICFHPNGIGGDGKGMLYLPQDRDIPFADSLTLRFNKTTFSADYTTVIDSGTYVSWDCQGFRSLRVAGAVIFGRNLLVEDKLDGTVGTNQIKAEFMAQVRRKSQWMTRLTFNHPFQIAGAPGWGFEVQDAWLDFSDNENAAGFSFPDNYTFDTLGFTGGVAPDSTLNAGNYWKGFYLKRLAVKLPAEFKTFSDPTQRITASVNNMLIDRQGLSASFRLDNLLQVADGNLSGWGFSIDTLMVDVVMNSFSRGGFVGEVRVPVSDSTLNYSSLLRQNIATKTFSYELRIQPKDTINAELWAAQLSLAPTSHISAVIDSSGCFAKAELNGNITIDTDLDGIGHVNFRFMEFEQLAFQTRAPYVICDSNCVRFAFASPQKMLGGEDDYFGREDDVMSPPVTAADSSGGGLSGFPVSIRNIGITVRDGGAGPRAGLVFTLALNLTGETNTFSAATTLAIMGKLNMGGGAGQMWEFDGIDLDSIGISGSVGIVELRGGLRFYNSDPTFGNGFKGFIYAKFKPTIEAQVSAQFGEKTGMRYWYVDAQVLFNPGITLMAGLDVYGFGGGAYYHMRRSPLPAAAAIATTDTTGRGGPGGTLTGCTFVPDASTAFGFSATLIFGSTGGGDAYNADVTFEASFNPSGGIRDIGLRGNGYFMCGITDRGSNPPVRASVSIRYDFSHDIFDGNFQVAVNVLDVLRGVNPGNIAGTVNIYASPATWHIFVGTPETPIGLEVAGIARMQSYLMVGLNLPAPTAPPAEVSSIITPALVVRNPSMETGDGFAFGSRYSLNTGRIGFLVFYARLNMGMGFDMALMNYGPGVFCEGMPPGSTVGVDGWYASGQMYAYIRGDIGIYVDLWFTSGEYKILEMGAAALVQGGLPNPSWLQGTCGGYYNILNGMVKGTCQFEFKVGNECRPAPESPLTGIDVLSELVPYNGERNVDCGINPEAVFNAEVNRPFDLDELRSDGTYRIRRFRFVLDRFTLSKAGASVTVSQQIGSDNLRAMLIPNAFLDPFTSYTAYVKIRGEEYNFATSSWGPALKRDGSPIMAEKQNTFVTGAYPDRIPDNNILVSYPFNLQRFFLQDECSRGFVKLRSWMPPLLTTTPAPNTIRKFKVRFIPVDGGAESESQLTFDPGVNSIYFDIPTLLNNKTYACQLISKDSSTSFSTSSISTGLSGMLSSISTTSTGINPATMMMQTSTLSTIYSATAAGGVDIRSNRINGRTVRKNEKLLYVFFFRTSQFNTLRDKINTFTPTTTAYRTFWGMEWLDPSFSGTEKFDVFDVRGASFASAPGYAATRIPPLVMIHDARADNWNSTFADPVIYSLYSNLRSYRYTYLSLLRSTPDSIGIPPFKTVYFHDDNPTRNELLPNEYLPFSSSPSSVFANLSPTTVTGLYGSTGSVSPFSGFSSSLTSATYMKLTNATPSRTYADYLRMRTIVSNVTAYYGIPPASEFYTEPVKSQLIRYLNSSWIPITRGTYHTNFFYRTPYFLCDDPDGVAVPAVKTYVY